MMAKTYTKAEISNLGGKYRPCSSSLNQIFNNTIVAADSLLYQRPKHNKICFNAIFNVTASAFKHRKESLLSLENVEADGREKVWLWVVAWVVNDVSEAADQVTFAFSASFNTERDILVARMLWNSFSWNIKAQIKYLENDQAWARLKNVHVKLMTAKHAKTLSIIISTTKCCVVAFHLIIGMSVH